jgi:hypothetical protein
VFEKICGEVAWCLLLFPLTYGIASSAVKYFVRQEVWDERLEVNDHQYEPKTLINVNKMSTEKTTYEKIEKTTACLITNLFEHSLPRHHNVCSKDDTMSEFILFNIYENIKK